MRSILDRLAFTLPDIPRWLEARSMLLLGRCEVLSLEEEGSEPRFVARELEESEEPAIIVVGRPASEAIEEAVRRTTRTGGSSWPPRKMRPTSAEPCRVGPPRG